MEMKKKDLRTFDVVTYRNGEERMVYLNTPEGGVLKKGNLVSAYLNQFYNDLTPQGWSNNFDIIKVTRNGKTIFERAEKLPYGVWYRFENGNHPLFMAFYTDKNTAFGFSGKDAWNDLSNDWDELDSYYHEPVPTEEWQARLIEYAKERGYRNGNYDCLYDPDDTLEVEDESKFFIDEAGVWHGEEDNLVLDFETGKWAEIVEQPEPIVLVCHTPCAMLYDGSETLTVGKEYPIKNDNGISYIIIDDEGDYHHFPKEADHNGDSFKKWFYIKGEKQELHSDLSTDQLIELLKKRTGADHVQILIDKQEES